MAEDKFYTQEEYDEAIQLALRNQAQFNFETSTKKVLADINRRLDEANGYKNTIGKDVKELKDDVKILQTYIEGQEERRKQETLEALEARREAHAWWQDKWVRRGIIASIVWEAFNILQGIFPIIHSGVHIVG